MFAMTMGLCGLSSCSEENTGEEEYANWQARNELFLASIATDSMQNGGWERYKKYSLDQTTEGKASEYVYVKKIDHSGESTVMPNFTDSVRVIYQGRLLPSKSYSQGYVFDGTVNGEYSVKMAYTSRQLVSNMIDGYSTALQHMTVGDHWRIYIPSELGYGVSGSTKIPGYSVLIFEVTLLDVSPAGQVMKPWR
jgi:FKBP-type peptidyl-prolyl cis-trans isomerase FklB